VVPAALRYALWVGVIQVQEGIEELDGINKKKIHVGFQHWFAFPSPGRNVWAIVRALTINTIKSY
jgi:hypothetical protein